MGGEPLVIGLERFLGFCIWLAVAWNVVHVIVVWGVKIYEPVVFGSSMAAMALGLGLFMASRRDWVIHLMARVLMVLSVALGMVTLVIELSELLQGRAIGAADGNPYVTTGLSVPGFRQLVGLDESGGPARAAFQSRLALMVYLCVLGGLVLLYTLVEVVWTSVCKFNWQVFPYVKNSDTACWCCTDPGADKDLGCRPDRALYIINVTSAVGVHVFVLALAGTFLAARGSGLGAVWTPTDTYYVALCVLAGRRAWTPPNEPRSDELVPYMAEMGLVLAGLVAHCMMFSRIVEHGNSFETNCFLTPSCITSKYTGNIQLYTPGPENEFTVLAGGAANAELTASHHGIELGLFVVGLVFYLARMLELVLNMCWRSADISVEARKGAVVVPGPPKV